MKTTIRLFIGMYGWKYIIIKTVNADGQVFPANPIVLQDIDAETAIKRLYGVAESYIQILGRANVTILNQL